MDFEKLDPDFFTRAGAYTPHIFRDVYPAIDPASPPLSQEGKVVIITGAAGGIGTGITAAFARSGARAVVLVGRSKEKLEKQANLLRKEYPSVQILTAPADISNEADVDSVFDLVRTKLSAADVLVNNAGALGAPNPIAASSPKSWWNDFEINTKGTYLSTKGFLNYLGGQKRGVIINISSGAAINVVPGMSSYSISKLAVNRLTEYVAAENSNIVSITLDPGTVSTDMVIDSFRKFAKDTPELVGGFTVWLTTESASFLNGRTVVANWSVDDLVTRKEQISAGNDLKVALQGKFGLPQ